MYQVIPNAYSVHMDPKFWKDPENFRPERFLDPDNKIINSQRVIAFGLGMLWYRNFNIMWIIQLTEITLCNIYKAPLHN